MEGNVSEELIDQQTRTQLVSLTPLEIAGLLSLLRSIEQVQPYGTSFDVAAQHLRRVIEKDSGIDVHDDAVRACVRELAAEVDRGSDLVQGKDDVRP